VSPFCLGAAGPRKPLQQEEELLPTERGEEERRRTGGEACCGASENGDFMDNDDYPSLLVKSIATKRI
jgi:hypothetical protein